MKYTLESIPGAARVVVCLALLAALVFLALTDTGYDFLAGLLGGLLFGLLLGELALFFKRRRTKQHS